MNLRSSCPELLESCRCDSPRLKVFPEDESGFLAPPYAICDGFESSAFDARCVDLYPAEILEKTDYFVIALGSDEKNIR